MDYVRDVLDPADDSEAARQRLRGWLDGVQRGFHEERTSDATWDVFLKMCLADGVRPKGVWLPEGAYGAGPLPVATYSSWDKDLNVGGGRHLPVRMITDITVSPAHRRRGLLRSLIEPDLADAVAAGVPLACLTVSEATIYGRFGFGPATFKQVYEVDTTSGFAVAGPPDPGRVELIEPADGWPAISTAFETFHTTSRGSVRRPYFYEPWHTGAFDFDAGGEDKKSRLAVHLDADGQPDGYALWKHKGWDGDGPATVELRSLVAPDPAAWLALWRFIGDIDLSGKVTFNGASVRDPLRWAVSSSDRVKVKKVVDHIWVRVLDAPVALGARPWYADGRVVLEVDDPQGHTSGRWAIDVTEGRAEVTATDDEADARLAAETLAALYLGGVDVGTLAAAGRVTGPGVERFAAAADGGPAPYSVTSF